MEEYGIEIPQPMAQQSQGSGVTAKPMYAIELPEASNATTEDQIKSQTAWKMFAGGWCCILLFWILWKNCGSQMDGVAFSGQGSEWLEWSLVTTCFLFWLWPIAVCIFYCQIPASQRSNYPKTRTPVMLTCGSCAACCCCSLLGFSHGAARLYLRALTGSPSDYNTGLVEGEGTTTTPQLQANFLLVGRTYCSSYEDLIVNGEVTDADSLADCQTKCGDSEHCQAIHWWNGGSDRCELLNQTNIETFAPLRIQDEEADFIDHGVECWKKQVELFDRVRLVQDVVGRARGRWAAGWRSHLPKRRFQLFQGDFGTVNSVSGTLPYHLNSVSWTGCLRFSVIFDKDLKREVWVNPDHLVKYDPPLAEVDDELIEEVLKNFPSAEAITTLKCPITEQFFIDPVVAHDGRTYEKSALEKASNHSEDFVTNYAMKSVLEALNGKVVVGTGAEAAAAEATAEVDSSSEETEELSYFARVRGFAERLRTGQRLRGEASSSEETVGRLRTSQRPSSQTMLDVAIFKCPISQELFKEPVVASDGHTYEKTLIMRALLQNEDTYTNSPITRERLTSVLIPNRAIKSLLSVLIHKADASHGAAHVQ